MTSRNCSSSLGRPPKAFWSLIQRRGSSPTQPLRCGTRPLWCVPTMNSCQFHKHPKRSRQKCVYLVPGVSAHPAVAVVITYHCVERFQDTGAEVYYAALKFCSVHVENFVKTLSDDVIEFVMIPDLRRLLVIWCIVFSFSSSFVSCIIDSRLGLDFIFRFGFMKHWKAHGGVCCSWDCYGVLLEVSGQSIQSQYDCNNCTVSFLLYSQDRGLR